MLDSEPLDRLDQTNSTASEVALDRTQFTHAGEHARTTHHQLACEVHQVVETLGGNANDLALHSFAETASRRARGPCGLLYRAVDHHVAGVQEFT